MTSLIKCYSDAALGFFFPEVCQLCGKHRATPEQGYVCGICRDEVLWIHEPLCSRCGLPFEGAITHEFECSNCSGMELHFDWARSAAVACGPLLEAIHRYKYNGQMWYEVFLANVLMERALPMLTGESWDAIIPVPLHPARRREREFNQAEQLAARLSRASGIPLRKGALKRIKLTETQTHLTRQRRMENVRGAFAVLSADEIRDRRCLIVDDVLTTGCTTSECARALREAQAAAVGVWTVARADSRRAILGA